MKLSTTPIAGLHTIHLDRIDDERGHLHRIFDAVEWRGMTGRTWQWDQVVTSFTQDKNTLRGMHYQLPPNAEGKLVIPLAGRMFWASVDVRPASPSFCHWHGIPLSPDSNTALLAQPGFAHGCLSLSTSVSLLILSTQTHRAAQGAGFRWDDPTVGIRWPDLGAPPLLSRAHKDLTSFSTFAATLGDWAREKEVVHA